jgi:peptidoglycan/xylan/chitin deacetylase (PgdA/CDA1 family)
MTVRIAILLGAALVAAAGLPGERAAVAAGAPEPGPAGPGASEPRPAAPGSDPGPGPAAAERAVALTFDDLPGVARPATLKALRRINRGILRALRSAGAPATGFVNEGALQVEGERDARCALLQAWLDAGMTLGNHTFAHLGLTLTSVPEYENDVIRGEIVTRALLAARGLRLDYFRYPFNQTGLTSEVKETIEHFLAGRGYTLAPFTIESADYAFARVYDAAAAAGDGARARAARSAYLEHTERMFEWFEGLARDEFGRDIRHIALMHANNLNADVLPDLLDHLKARGYRFITLGEALADAAYATPDRYVGGNGPSWLHRWSVALDRPMRLRDEPDPPRWILDGFAAESGASAPAAGSPRR